MGLQGKSQHHGGALRGPAQPGSAVQPHQAANGADTSVFGTAGSALRRARSVCGTVNLLLLCVIVIMIATLRSGVSIAAVNPFASISPATPSESAVKNGQGPSGQEDAVSGASSLHRDVQAAESRYRRFFPLREEAADTGADGDHEGVDVFGFPLGLYHDGTVCVARGVDSVGPAVQTSSRAPWALLRCTTGETDDSRKADKRKPAATAHWRDGVDRWIHPLVLRGDNAGMSGDGDPDRAEATGTDGALHVGPSTYFARHPMNTKVIRNALYFRRVKTVEGLEGPATPAPTAAPETAQASDTLSPPPAAADGTTDGGGTGHIYDLSSAAEGAEAAALAGDAPNDASERFVVASVDPYATDRTLFRRMGEAEAARAIKHAMKKSGPKRSRKDMAPSTAANASVAQRAAQELEQEASDASAGSTSDSNFVGGRGSLGFFAHAHAVWSRAPDPIALGEGFGHADLTTVDTVRFMRLVQRLSPLPGFTADPAAVARVTFAAAATEPTEAAPTTAGPAAAVGVTLAPLPPPATSDPVPDVLATSTIPLAFVVNIHTCLANHWHATTEVALPLFALLLRHGAITPGVLNGSVAPPPVFARAPPRNTWGIYNRGCPSLNQWPYGLSTKSAWILRTVAPSLVWFDERGDHRRNLETRAVQPLNASVAIGRLVVSGLDYTCGGALDPLTFYTVATGWSSATTSVAVGPNRRSALEAYPFLLTEPQQCDDFLPTFRRFIVARHLGGDGSGEEDKAATSGGRDWITPAEAQCPVVVVLLRQGSRNGRHVENADEVMAAVTEHVEAVALSNACPELQRVRALELHAMAPAEQLRALANATMVLAMRGAATIAASLVRPGAAVVTLTPVHFSVPLSFRNDNVPWWPFYTLRKDVAIAMGVCRAVVARGQPAHFTNMCRKRSVNFCNAKCDPAHIHALLRTVQAAQAELTFEAALLVHVYQKVLRASDGGRQGDDDAAGLEARVRKLPIAFATLVDGAVDFAMLSKAVVADDQGAPLWSMPKTRRHEGGGAGTSGPGKPQAGGAAARTVVTSVGGHRVNHHGRRTDDDSDAAQAGNNGAAALDGFSPEAMERVLAGREASRKAKLRRQLQDRDDRHVAGEADTDFPRTLVTVIAPDVTRPDGGETDADGGGGETPSGRDQLFFAPGATSGARQTKGSPR